MLKKATILISALLIATLSGCGSTFRFFKAQNYLNSDLIEASHDATDELKDQLCSNVPKGSLIVVSTLLNVKKNPNETSSFGRIISDQIATALHNSGYQIIALDLPIDLFMMEEGGELLLSEKDKALLGHYKAAVMVGGVYAPGKQNTYVTLRAVNRFTRHVIASTDFSVFLGSDVKTLLKAKDTSSSSASTGSAGSIPDPVIEESTSNATDTAPFIATPTSVGESTPNPTVEGAPSKQEETPANNPAAGVKSFPSQME